MELIQRLMLIAVIATAVGSVRAAPAAGADEGVQMGIEDADDELIDKRDDDDDDDDDDDEVKSNQNQVNVDDEKLRRGR